MQDVAPERLEATPTAETDAVQPHRARAPRTLDAPPGAETNRPRAARAEAIALYPLDQLGWSAKEELSRCVPLPAVVHDSQAAARQGPNEVVSPARAVLVQTVFMDEARRLRTRLFQELGAYGLLVASVGCGGVVVIEKGGSTGAGGAEPTTASSTSSSTVGVSTGAGPMCSSGGTATEECQLAQSDGSCLDPSQVQDGCCNAADGVTKKGDMCCYWFCPGPCCGRPYVVDGSARRARPIGRSDWAITTPPGAGGALSADSRRERYELEPASRDALTRAWLADALAEHASIASFARFTLDLLALGAPASMVRDAQRAMLDEIEHARLCFGLASRFGATAWGPGALDVEGSRAGVTLADSAARAPWWRAASERRSPPCSRASSSRARPTPTRASCSRGSRTTRSGTPCWPGDSSLGRARWAAPTSGRRSSARSTRAREDRENHASTPTRPSNWTYDGSGGSAFERPSASSKRRFAR